LGTQEVAFAAAKVARIPKVRAALFQVQRDFATQTGGAVLDGRDMGSRICPEAEVKLFINAEPEIRAQRRAKQLNAQGIKVSHDEMLAQILARDESDRLNPAGAFYPATDAHLLDTDELDIEAALKAAIAVVDATMLSGLD
jgi:cytidylate kinase